MAKSLALEVAPVRVNLIAAGLTGTPLPGSLPGDRTGELREQLRTTLPIGRVVGPADIAALAVHLMTNTAVTGATFDIDGGQQLIGELLRARLGATPVRLGRCLVRASYDGAKRSGALAPSAASMTRLSRSAERPKRCCILLNRRSAPGGCCSFRAQRLGR
jgi:hypothetical protein